MINNLPIQLLKRNRSKQVIVATPAVENKSTLESMRSIKVEGRPGVGLWLVFLVLVRFVFITLDVLKVALFVCGCSGASFLRRVLGFCYILTTLLLFFNLYFAA